MRIEAITLSWFRGAAENAALDTGSKRVVIYGANGSGKSTFADARHVFRSDPAGWCSARVAPPLQACLLQVFSHYGQ